MIEVVFSQSAFGGLKYAQNYNNEVGIGGNSKDIFCFSNDLSIGDISGDCFSQNRLNFLSEYFSAFPEDLSYSCNQLKQAKESLNDLIDRANHNEVIRIWYSEQPHE